MTMTELAPKATTESPAKKKTPVKRILAGFGIAAITGALCGFTFAGISTDETFKHDDALKQDVQGIAVQLDVWAGKQASADTKISIDAYGVSDNTAFDAIKSDPALQDVVWAAYGTADAYCIKAYSKNGGEKAPFNALTYDSISGELGTTVGACAPASKLPEVSGPVEMVKPEVGGSAGKEVASPVGEVTPEDNTDIR